MQMESGQGTIMIKIWQLNGMFLRDEQDLAAYNKAFQG